jgi:hypothetical protein
MFSVAPDQSASMGTLGASWRVSGWTHAVDWAARTRCAALLHECRSCPPHQRRAPAQSAMHSARRSGEIETIARMRARSHRVGQRRRCFASFDMTQFAVLACGARVFMHALAFEFECEPALWLIALPRTGMKAAGSNGCPACGEAAPRHHELVCMHLCLLMSHVKARGMTLA